MGRLPHGKLLESLAKVAVRLIFPYGHTVCPITADDESEFCCHKLTSKYLVPQSAQSHNLMFLPTHIYYGRKALLKMHINLSGNIFQ